MSTSVNVDLSFEYFPTADGFTEYVQQKKLKLQTLFLCVLPTLLFIVIVQVFFNIVSKSTGNSCVFPKVRLARYLNGLLKRKLHFNHNSVTIAPSSRGYRALSILLILKIEVSANIVRHRKNS